MPISITTLVAAFALLGFQEPQATPQEPTPIAREELELEQAQRDLADAEAQWGEAVLEIVPALLALADVHQRLGNFARQAALSERALTIHENELGAEHPTTASTATKLAFARRSLGDHYGAKALVERALAIYEAQPDSHELKIASALTNLGQFLNAEGDHEGARRMHERSVAIKSAHLEPDDPDLAKGLNNLANSIAATGAYEEARPYFERALAAHESRLGPGHSDSCTIRGNLAVLLYHLGDFGGAKELMEETLAFEEAQFGPDHPRTAFIQNDLAGVLEIMGAYEESKRLYTRALATFENRLGPDHPQTAVTLDSLALLLRNMGEHDEAVPLIERALEIQMEALGPTHPDTIVTMGNLAALKFSLEEHEEALGLCEELVAIHEDLYGERHPYTGLALGNLGVVLHGMNRLGEAEAYFERSLSIREEQLGIEHPETTSGLMNLAGLALDQRDPQRAWSLIERAQRGSRAGLARLLATRTADEGRKYLARRHRDQDLVLSMARVCDDPEIALGVGSHLLAWKGQIGRAERAVRKLAQESGEARALSARLRENQAELSRHAYRVGQGAGARAAGLDQLRDEIRELDLELRGLVGTDTPDGLDVPALLELVPEGSALLSFFVHSVYRPARYEGEELVEAMVYLEPRLVAWIMRPGRPLVSVDLGLASDVERRIEEFLRGLSNSRGVALANEEHDPNAALREVLWQPLAKHLAEASLIVVSHDRFTATLPFEVLADEDGRFLLGDRSFVYLHDLQSIGGFEATPTRECDALLCVGGVDFNDRTDPEQATTLALRGGASAPSERWQFWSSLDATRAEAATIRDLHRVFVRDGSRVVLTGTEASEERVLEEMPRASLVHLATHGYFRPQGLPSMWQAALESTPRGAGFSTEASGLLEADLDLTGYLPEVLSGLVLAGANLPSSPERLDGYLTAADVDWMDLSGVELVTLSACETGLGRAESGEGMSGFRTTLLRAGARTVVSSLWQVPDDSTEKLMSRFYENLLRHGMGKLEALREAQLWMLRENRRQFAGEGRPHTWGAFVLSGDWR